MATNSLNIPLPKAWSSHIKLAVLQVISLARVALVAASGRVARSKRAPVRLQAELAEARREVSLLTEELRLKDLRMSRLRPRRRPSRSRHSAAAPLVVDFLSAIADNRMGCRRER